MDVGNVSSFLLLCSTTVAAAIVATYCMRRWAPVWGFVDRPDGRRKMHSQPIPLLGGMAVLIALALGVGMAYAGGWLTCSTKWLGGWLLTAGGFSAIGLVDDRRPMRPRTKFLWQVFACLPYVMSIRSISHLDLGWGEIPLGWWAAPVTIFWLVACVNAINLLDGLDGLAAGTVGISCLAWACLASWQGQGSVVVLALLLFCSLLGFLAHNRPPAKIFLGDTGSLMLGFCTGSLALEVGGAPQGTFVPVLPLIVVSLPLFDTTMAIVRRKLNGRGIGDADREHIHHCLQDRGWSRSTALSVLLGICAIQALWAVAGAIMGQPGKAGIASCLVLGVLIVARLFGHRETVLAAALLRRRMIRWSQARRGRFNPLEWLAF